MFVFVFVCCCECSEVTRMVSYFFQSRYLVLSYVIRGLPLFVGGMEQQAML